VVLVLERLGAGVYGADWTNVAQNSRGPHPYYAVLEWLPRMDRVKLVFRAENEHEHEHEQTLTWLPTTQPREDRRKGQPRNSA
jgi:hypothetical protein